MIRLSNGHQFQFMTASGALAFDGRGWPWEWPLRWAGLLDPKLFTIVTKTLTRQPRRGHLRWSHPWSVVKKIGNDGVVNAIGLTNPGFDWWLEEILPKIPEEYKIVASVEADDENDLVEMIRRLERKAIMGIELNLSCPNTVQTDRRTTEKIISLCRAAAGATTHPLIAKLSVTHDYKTIVKEIFGIQAVSINSVPWQAAYPEKPSPLLQYGGGGVSGRLAQHWTWKMAGELATTSSIPVIGPSVWDYDDIKKLFAIGAKAVSFGSVFVFHPWRPTLYARRFTSAS